MVNKIEFWNNSFQEGRDYSPFNIIFQEKLFGRIGKNIQNGLDLGCGTGDLVVKFAKRNIMMTGLDISNVAIEKARERAMHEKLENQRFFSCNIENEDEVKKIIQPPFDIITCKLVYAFLEDRERFLQFIKEIMSENGLFLLMTPVLYPDIEYDQRLQKISVDKEKVTEQLKKLFKNVEIFHENFFEEKGSEITFLIQK